MIRKLAQIFALILIFTIPWENAFTFGSLGSISRIFGLMAAGLWAISVLLRRKIRGLNYFYIFVFAFLLFNVSSIFWTYSFDYTFERVKTYLQMVIQIWMLWDLITTENLHRSALMMFIFGAYIAIASTLYNFATGQQISQYEYGRFTGGGQNAVELAIILSLCIPIAWHLAMTQKASRFANLLKFLYFFFIPPALFSIILTASRTALLTIIPAIIYIIASLGRFKLVYRFIGFFVFIFAIFAGQSLVPQATLSRLSTFGSAITYGTLGGRLGLWKQAIQIYMEHPILGIGSGALAAPNQLGAFAHNTFLSIMAELGIVGFLFFVGVMVSAFLQALNQPKPFAFFWLTEIVTWIIAVQSLTWEYSKPTWFILNMVAISAGCFIQQKIPARRELQLAQIE